MLSRNLTDDESKLLNKISKALTFDFPMINLVEINDKILHRPDTKRSDYYVLFDEPLLEDYLMYDDKKNTACRRRPEVVYFNLADTYPLIRGKLYLKFKSFLTPAEAKAETPRSHEAERA